MYREVAPGARLRSLVSSVWTFPRPRAERSHRVLPDGCMDIVVAGGRAMIVGSMRSAVCVPPMDEATLGIRMRPGEAERLFPGMAAELTDRDALLTDVWADEGRRLEDALLALLERATAARHEAHSILRAALPVVEDALVTRLSNRGVAADVRTRAAAALLGEGRSVAAVAEHVGLSERQLARRFFQRVGLSPKTYARVRRLQRAVLLLQRGATISAVAADAGYADQPHFTREAKELAGATPAVLVGEGSETVVPVVL